MKYFNLKIINYSLSNIKIIIKKYFYFLFNYKSILN